MSEESELKQTNALLRAIHEDMRDLISAIKMVARGSA